MLSSLSKLCLDHQSQSHLACPPEKAQYAVRKPHQQGAHEETPRRRRVQQHSNEEHEKNYPMSEYDENGLHRQI